MWAMTGSGIHDRHETYYPPMIRIVARIAMVLPKILQRLRRSQVWDAEVTAEATGAVIALFRCTQMVLYPRV